MVLGRGADPPTCDRAGWRVRFSPPLGHATLPATGASVTEITNIAVSMKGCDDLIKRGHWRKLTVELSRPKTQKMMNSATYFRTSVGISPLDVLRHYQASKIIELITILHLHWV